MTRTRALALLLSLLIVFVAAQQCKDVRLNEDYLSRHLMSSLFGQHLATRAIETELKDHFRHEPSRLLLMSLNGPPGTGKSLSVQIIVDAIYPNAEGQSPFVVRLSAPVNPTKLDETIRQLRQVCERSMVIIDNAEKLSPDAFATIHHYYDAKTVAGVSYNKMIILLTSTAGSEQITELVAKRYKTNRRENSWSGIREVREGIDYDYFVKENVFADYKNRLKDRHILHPIPFLPLDFTHIVRCARRVAKENHKEMDAKKLLYQLKFVPAGQEWFVENGCKALDAIKELH